MRALQRSQTGVVNETLTEATEVMKKVDTQKGSLAKIEFLVCLTALLLIFLAIFRSSRCRHSNPKLKILLWTSYTLSSYLITYTLGLMAESSFKNELFPVWATFLMIFFGSSDSISAYNLEDNEQWKNYTLQFLIKNFWLVMLLIVYGEVSPLFLGIWFLYIMVLLKVGERALSLVTASGYGLQRTTKLIADYMSSEHQSSDPRDLDAIQMKGYNYIVRGEETRWVNGFVHILEKLKGREAAEQREALNYRKSMEITDEVITVEKVWRCQGWLFSSRGGDEDGKLKDICLSFSLYKLLSLRFCSYSLPKEAHKKLWNLIRHGFHVEGKGYERAFRVIELELSFLFDLFYTKYPIIFYPGHWQVKVIELLSLVIGSLETIILCLSWYNSKRAQDEVQLATSGRLSFDVVVTSLILLVFTCVELVQLFFMAISEWTKVSLLCKYVRTNSWQENKRIEKLIGLICRTQFLKPWERKLRQYSLLESHGYTPSRWLYNSVTATFIDPIRDGQKLGAPVKLSSEVKQASFHSLMSYSGVLENGEASLRLNKVAGKLCWACRLETQTQVIIVWHIATSICEHEVRISDSNFLVATNLSKYLAYLVAFSPKLLPDHPYDTEFAFHQIILELRNLLKGCKTGGERIRKLKDIGRTMDDAGRVIFRGAQLGQQLLTEEDPEFIWKVLAEFWAEFIVYVAPSDDAKAHAEHLAMGGEFVTHLWPLVSHAGIKRDPPVERPTLNRSRSWSS